MHDHEHRIRRVVDALRERNNLARNPQPIVLGAAATEMALAVFEAIAPFPLPPSYVALLQEHDGIEGFYGESGELVSTRYRFQDDPRWEGWVDRANAFLIARDGPRSAVFLDGATRGADGECEVIEVFDGGRSTRFASLLAFLDGYAERVEEALRAPA